MVGSGLSGTKTNHTRDVIVINFDSTHPSQKAEEISSMPQTVIGDNSARKSSATWITKRHHGHVDQENARPAAINKHPLASCI